jgi:glycosyltransferase involved in cell wall biosynthesis
LKTILFIGHDAKRAGAQIVLLTILQELNSRNIPTHLLLANGGPLESQYREVTNVTMVAQPKETIFSAKIDWCLSAMGLLKHFRQRERQAQQKQFEQQLSEQNIGLIFANTIATAAPYRAVEFLNVPLVLFVHELDMSIKMYSEPAELGCFLSQTQHLITPSKATTAYYERVYGFSANKTSHFQVVDIAGILTKIQEGQLVDIRQKLNLPADAVLIGSCGNAEWRKGNDIFMAVAQNVINRMTTKPVYFVWIGISSQSDLYDIQRSDAQKMGLSDRIIHVEPTPDVFQYISQLDIFGLFSREEPYPLVVLEAALAQKPIVCFEGSGGAPEFVETDCGFVVPYLDVVAIADKIVYLIDNPTIKTQLGQAAKQKVLHRHPTAPNIDKVLAITNSLILK